MKMMVAKKNLICLLYKCDYVKGIFTRNLENLIRFKI